MLYSFSGKPDGAYPNANVNGLIFGSGGALYGTTEEGGASNYGTVFKLTPPARGETTWTETVLYSFGAFPDDGENPYAGLVFGENGALYSTTLEGGTSTYGTVFKLTPPRSGQNAWTETVLYSFGASSPDDGAYPYGGLVFGENGALYSTTSAGGTSENGTVFKLSPPARGETAWTETVLYSFGTTPVDGAEPSAGLILGSDGALYGTTLLGGASGHGTVFALTAHGGETTWTEKVLYSFAGDPDGALPDAGLIFGWDGVLYGTTLEGGSSGMGTIFQLSPHGIGETTWTETVLLSFTGPDGASPDASLIFGWNGALYGTTVGGGASDRGTVFRLSPSQ